MLPVLTIPILLGGVSAKDCAMALLIDSTVLVFALAAGLLASAFTKDWVRAFVLAEVLSVTFVVWFMFLHGDAFKDLMRGRGFIAYGYGSFLRDVTELIYFHTNLAQESSFRFGPWSTTWNDIWSIAPAARQADWFRLVAGYLTMSVIFLGAAILIAAWQVRQSWRAQPASKEIMEVQQSLTRPRFAVQRLRRRLSRGLDRNPIGWLHQYSWNARVTKWGWLLLVVVTEILLLSDLQTFDYSQRWVMLIVLAGLAFSAASSFRRERETGVLELLLVCPLAVSQIILGRVRGIWMQFFPTAALVALCAFVGRGTRVFHDPEDNSALIYLVLGMAFLTIPMVGLQFSTSHLNAVAGWLCTLVLGLFGPGLTPFFFGGLNANDQVFMALSSYTVICSHLMIAGGCWALLHHRLKRRRFALVAA